MLNATVAMLLNANTNIHSKVLSNLILWIVILHGNINSHLW